MQPNDGNSGDNYTFAGRSTKLYRPQSLKQIKSPDQLADYIRVARTSTWLILGVIMVLLTGLLVWSIFGRIETQIGAYAITTDDNTILYVNLSDESRLWNGMSIEINGCRGKLLSIFDDPLELDSDENQAIRFALGLEVNDWCRVAEAKFDELPNGAIEADVILEKLHPIDLLME